MNKFRNAIGIAISITFVNSSISMASENPNCSVAPNDPKWDTQVSKSAIQKRNGAKEIERAREVVVTNTRRCDSEEACAQLIAEMKKCRAKVVD